MSVLEDFKSACAEADVSPPVAAIRALSGTLSASAASTFMELCNELKQAADCLTKHAKENFGYHFFFPVQAASEMFIKYIMRSSSTLMIMEDFEGAKQELILRGKRFGDRLLASRERVAAFGAKFIGDGQTVMCHGYSRAVVNVLRKAMEKNRNFDVIVLEGKPEGLKLAKRIAEYGIPVKLVPDSAIGFIMERVDLVLVGAESIMENGGVANRVGTYPLAVVAKVHKKPFYVAAESFKFTRFFPLSQREIEEADTRSEDDKLRSSNVFESATIDAAKQANLGLMCPETDYTAPEFITLIFTDLGVLTPAAISDELIKLYQ